MRPGFSSGAALPLWIATMAMALGSTSALRAQETPGPAGEPGEPADASQEENDQPPKLKVAPIALLRAGLRVEPDSSPRPTGFDLFDARLGVVGGFGSILTYLVWAGFETSTDEIDLLDATLSLTFMPELHLDVGQYKVPFSREELLLKGDIQFADRAQAVNAIAPGRQVGAGLSGSFFERRLWYGVGLFNGNGRSLANDNGSFLYGGRVQFDNVGSLGFRDEFVIQVGGNLAFSRDSAVDLSRMGGVAEIGEELEAFRGDRFLWGLDLHAAYRGFFADAEFLRAELQPTAGALPAAGFPAGAGLAGDELVAQGGYLQAGYQFLHGFVEGLARYDAFDPVGGEDRDYLLLGANLYYLHYFRFELQYAIGLHDSPPSPELSDGQFIFFLQLRI